MEKLHRHTQNTDEFHENKEEQRRCLCSNSIGTRCSSLNLSREEEDILIDNKLKELAEILIEAFLKQKGLWIDKPQTQLFTAEYQQKNR